MTGFTSYSTDHPTYYDELSSCPRCGDHGNGVYVRACQHGSIEGHFEGQNWCGGRLDSSADLIHDACR